MSKIIPFIKLLLVTLYFKENIQYIIIIFLNWMKLFISHAHNTVTLLILGNNIININTIFLK